MSVEACRTGGFFFIRNPVRFVVHLAFLFLALLSATIPVLARAGEDCAKTLSVSAFSRWIHHETRENFPDLHKSDAPVDLEFVNVPSSELEVRFFGQGAEMPELRQLLFDGAFTRMYRHPFNTFDGLPYAQRPASGRQQAFFTASRSMAVRIGGRLFTIKLATDHPIHPATEPDELKSSVAEDLRDIAARLPYLEKIEARFGADPQVRFAREVATVTDPRTGEGYLVRDMSFLKDGFEYLPAASLPYVGATIAAAFGQMYAPFWAEHYAAVVGRAKARLLRRFGLQFETPNPQNILLQLDSRRYPTGVIVLRDLSDTALVKPLAKLLGEDEALTYDAAHAVHDDDLIRPAFFRSILFFYGPGVRNDLTRVQSRLWRSAHDAAFKDELSHVLTQPLPEEFSLEQAIHNRFGKLDSVAIPALTELFAAPGVAERLASQREMRSTP